MEIYLVVSVEKLEKSVAIRLSYCKNKKGAGETECGYGFSISLLRRRQYRMKTHQQLH